MQRRHGQLLSGVPADKAGDSDELRTIAAAYRRREEEEGKMVRLVDQLAAVVESRLKEQYDAGMQPARIHPNTHVFAHGTCTHTTRNLTAPGAMMRLDAPPCCDDSTLRAAAQLVADLATPVLALLGTVRKIFAAYTNVTIEHFTRAQISGANPSGSPFVAGRIHPVDPVACTVATRHTGQLELHLWHLQRCRL